MLYDKSAWHKYAARDKTKASNWASIPVPPKVTVIIPAADTEASTWNYTTEKPAGEWMSPNFDDSSWKCGRSGFGTKGTPGAIIGTTWQTDDIWLRRVVEVPSFTPDDIQGWLYHDEDAEVYINGVLALKVSGFISNYDCLALSPQAKAALKPGKNVFAVHCHQTFGGQYVDFGLVDVQNH
jgi:hypothetical protein